MIRSLFLSAAVILLLSSQLISPEEEPWQTASGNPYFSPIDVTIDTNINRLFIAGKTAREIRSYSLEDHSSFSSCFTEHIPKALCLAGDWLLVACSYSEGYLLVLDKHSLKQLSSIRVGHGACDVEVSKDLSTAYVANQFSEYISVVDLNEMKVKGSLKALRQPRQISLSRDGRYLLAANFLPAGRADVDTVTSAVTVIDLMNTSKVRQIPLANGSNALRGMCLSADGLYAMITHNLGRFQLPTTQLEQGWMNTSALSIIRMDSMTLVATVLLDETEKGAAGSWGIHCCDEYVYVAHSGTHDVSSIDYRALENKLIQHPDKQSLAYDLTFLSGIRERIRIEGNGPRALISSGKEVYVANYFSDNLNVFSRSNHTLVLRNSTSLAQHGQVDEIRKGEQYFHDASFCFQSWQACTGCHPDDARTDGLNWDLLNDGMGNPKNCKSLLKSHVTAPSMITGIRPSAELAVRAGFEFIQFMQVSDSITRAVDNYLKSLEAIPSPHLVNGELSAAASKGRTVFENSGCAECHPAPLYTDQKKHHMGVSGSTDHQNSWDTPTLIETWRTGPYLHDGRCATMKEVFDQELHGLEAPLAEEQLNQLVSYVLSL
jgi:DNA-binding beta-propeller fold protein YncE